jgi:cellulose synthase (UDP-forming)
VTNVIDGTPAAEAPTAVHVREQEIVTNPVGNNGISAARWAADDVLTEQSDSAPHSRGSVARASWRRALNRPADRAARLAPGLRSPERAPAPSGDAGTALAAGTPAVTVTAWPAAAPIASVVTASALPGEVRRAVPQAATPLAGAPPTEALATDDTMPLAKVLPLVKTARSAEAPSSALAPLALATAQPALAAAAPEAVHDGQALPSPPTDDEKYSYVRRGAWLVTLLGTLSFPLLLYSQMRMMIQFHWFLLYSPFLFLAAIFLMMPLVTDALSRGFDFDRHRRLVAAWQPARYPSVDVFLPVCGEPLQVLRNTWNYVAAMASHYKGPVTAYVLDDSHSPELKEMAREFGFVYATRPNRGWFKKSGNLWFGYQVSYGEFILLLDADFAPRHDFLDEVLPYMDADPDLGIVQTPQFFRVDDKQTWVERGAGANQELFYRSIQSARARKGGAICVGSCALYRRAALKENSGMTLAEHSEDMLTGFDLRSIGWRLQYIPVALSTGNCPDNVLAFLNQQYRWCSGTVGLLNSKRFWTAKLPRYTRVCYISGLVYYIYTALFLFLMPVLTIAIMAFVPGILLFKNMIFMVPVLLYGALVFPRWHSLPFRLEAWATRVVAGWAHFWAYWDAIRGKRLGWKPSGSKKQDGGRRFWICFIVWSVGTSLAWVGLAFYRMLTMDPVNFAVLFGLGLFELLCAMRILIQPAKETHA